MEDNYYIYVIIALCVFLLWFFFGGSNTKTTQANSISHSKAHRPRDGIYDESREERVRRRLKARF